MSSITQDQFDTTTEQAQGGLGECTTVDQVELCSLVSQGQGQLTWTAVAQLPSDPTSAASMLAAGSAWESLALAHGLDPLVELEWTSPTIPTPGAGQSVTLRVVLSPTSDENVTLTCELRGRRRTPSAVTAAGDTGAPAGNVSSRTTPRCARMGSCSAPG